MPPINSDGCEHTPQLSDLRARLDALASAVGDLRHTWDVVSQHVAIPDLLAASWQRCTSWMIVKTGQLSLTLKEIEESCASQ